MGHKLRQERLWRPSNVESFWFRWSLSVANKTMSSHRDRSVLFTFSTCAFTTGIDFFSERSLFESFGASKIDALQECSKLSLQLMFGHLRQSFYNWRQSHWVDTWRPSDAHQRSNYCLIRIDFNKVNN